MNARTAGWKTSVAAGEGVRNWVTGRWLTIIGTMFAVAAFTIPTAADARAIDRLVQAEQAWERAGGRMLIATNDEQGGVSRAACEKLATVRGVAASASLSRLDARAGTPNAPEAGIVVAAAGEGIGALLGLDAASGVILPIDLADQLGVRAGDAVSLQAVRDPTAGVGGPSFPADPVPVAAVADTSVLGEQYAYAALLQVPGAGKAATCMLEASPGYLEAVREVVPGLLAVDGNDAIVADRLIGGQYARDFSAEYETRGLRYAPWVAGAAVTLLWVLMVWIRRGRDGLYSTLGADWSTRMIIRTSEGLALVVTSALLAGVAVTVTLVGLGVDLATVRADVARHLVIATGTAVTGALLSAAVPLRSPLASLKDH